MLRSIFGIKQQNLFLANFPNILAEILILIMLCWPKANFPRVQTSLFELCILLKNCRQEQSAEVLKVLETSGSKLLKRKLSSLDDSCGEKRVRLGCKDVLPHSPDALPAVLDELSDKVSIFISLLLGQNVLGQKYLQIQKSLIKIGMCVHNSRIFSRLPRLGSKPGIFCFRLFSHSATLSLSHSCSRQKILGFFWH
jgi:hypothetical protein